MRLLLLCCSLLLDLLFMSLASCSHLKTPADSKSVQKRQTSRRLTHEEFVEENLIEHSQALQYLINVADKTAAIVKGWVERNTLCDAPKHPENIETRRSSNNLRGEISVNPKQLDVMDNLKISDLESSIRYPVNEDNESRKPSESRKAIGNHWCSSAIICKRSEGQTCGFDEGFGFSKFDDICHMLDVNCYWNYNFSVVPSWKCSFIDQGPGNR